MNYNNHIIINHYNHIIWINWIIKKWFLGNCTHVFISIIYVIVTMYNHAGFLFCIVCEICYCRLSILSDNFLYNTLTVIGHFLIQHFVLIHQYFIHWIVWPIGGLGRWRLMHMRKVVVLLIALAVAVDKSGQHPNCVVKSSVS